MLTVKCPLTLLFAATLLLSPGCGKKDQVTVTRVEPPRGAVQPAPAPAPAPAAMPASHEAEPPKQVHIKAEVHNTQKGKWGGITISLQDAATGRQAYQTLKMGKAVELHATGLSVKVLNILSDFTMEHGVIKPGSDDLRNPAAQVEIYEHGQLKWAGWWFVQFPDDRKWDNNRIILRLLRIEPNK